MAEAADSDLAKGCPGGDHQCEHAGARSRRGGEQCRAMRCSA
jgi:hypothetical protein